jgi:hypothetical protein
MTTDSAQTEREGELSSTEPATRQARALVRYLLAAPFASGSIYAVLLAYSAGEFLEAQSSVVLSTFLSAFIGGSALLLAIGAYKSWYQKPGWGRWCGVSMVAYLMVALVYNALS